MLFKTLNSKIPTDNLFSTFEGFNVEKVSSMKFVQKVLLLMNIYCEKTLVQREIINSIFVYKGTGKFNMLLKRKTRDS